MKSANFDISIEDIKKYQWSIVASVIVVVVIGVVYLTLIAPITDRRHMLVTKIYHQQKLISQYAQKLGQSKVIRENLAKHEGALRQMQKKLFRGTIRTSSRLPSETFFRPRASPMRPSSISKLTRCSQARNMASTRKCT